MMIGLILELFMAMLTIGALIAIGCILMLPVFIPVFVIGAWRSDARLRREERERHDKLIAAGYRSVQADRKV